MTALLAILLPALSQSAHPQNCMFITDQAKLRPDVARLKMRLDDVQDEIDLAVRREVFEDVLLRQHFPLPGDHVVLAFWRRTRAIGVEDSLAYEYWTIQLPSLSNGASYELPARHSAAFFSAGGSAWVGHGRGFYGSSISGNLSIRRLTEAGALIDLNLRVRAAFAAQRGVPTDEFYLRGEYFLPKASGTEILAFERDCFGFHRQ